MINILIYLEFLKNWQDWDKRPQKKKREEGQEYVHGHRTQVQILNKHVQRSSSNAYQEM